MSDPTLIKRVVPSGLGPWAMAICLSGLLGSCQAQKTQVLQTSLPPAQHSSASDTPPPLVSTASTPANVDLATVVPASQPWKIVFVSQDGPKGHENISDQDCPEVVWCHMWQTAQTTAQELGVDTELAYVDEDCSQEQECIRQQIQLLNELIRRDDIDGMVIGPRDSNQLVPVVEKAIAKNIAVISVGTPINSPQVLTLVTFNDFEGGKAIGQWVAERLQGTGNVLIIEGPKYQKNALDRRHGFVAGLQGQNITILDTETALWSCQKAQTITEQWLRKFPNIDAIIAASDHMALGAAIATQTAQRPDILITGYDAIPIARATIANGTLAATAMQFPQTTTPTAIQLMVRHLETSEPFPEVVYLPTPQLLSQANLPEPSVDPSLDINCSF